MNRVQKPLIGLAVLAAIPLIVVYLAMQVALGFAPDSAPGKISRYGLSYVFPIDGGPASHGGMAPILGRFLMPLDSRHVSYAPDSPVDAAGAGAQLSATSSSGATSIVGEQICFGGDVDALRDSIEYQTELVFDLPGGCLDVDQINSLLTALSER